MPSSLRLSLFFLLFATTLFAQNERMQFLLDQMEEQRHAQIAPPVSREQPVVHEFSQTLETRAAGFDEFSRQFGQRDATLNDIYFLNSQFGWAVGDRGAIWHTKTAGRNWQLQKTDTTATLNSVHFINENIGIVVGGTIEPGLDVSRAVVLLTHDGGATWMKIAMPPFPALTQVRLTSPKSGWAAGLSSALYPSGIFSFANGGLDWGPISGPKTQGILQADFYGNFGCGIGADGTICPLGELRNEPFDKSVFSTQRPRALALFSVPAPGSGIHSWLIGDGGLTLRSADAGIRWQAAEQTFSPRYPELFDLKTVFANGNNVWIAGSPGTVIFRSDDSGKSWMPVLSGTSAEIRKITFLNPSVGFAAGEFGTILSTIDGGQSWQIQQDGGKRLALLNLVGRTEDISWAALASLCGEQGYFGGVLLLTRKDGDEANLSLEFRLKEAALQCGAISALQHWAFPTSSDEIGLSAEKILARFGDGGLLALRERIVRSIRKAKPNILLCADPGAKNADPLREMILRETIAAVRDAADPMAFPQHIQDAHLNPWRVDKVLLSLEKGIFGEINLPLNTISPQLGKSVAEAVQTAHAIMGTPSSGLGKSAGFQTEYDVSPARGDRQFFSNIMIPPGSDARRFPAPVSAAFVDNLVQIQTQRHNAQSLLENMIVSPTGTNQDKILAVAVEIAEKLPKNAAAALLMDVARFSRAKGHDETAVGLLQLAQNRFQSVDAVRELLLTNSGTLETTDAIARFLDNAASDVFYSPNVLFAFAAAMPKIQPTASQSDVWNGSQQPIASPLESKIQQCIAEIAKSQPNSPWGRRAASELILANADTRSTILQPEKHPLPIIVAHRAKERPFLDGQFDEAAWVESGMPYTFNHDTTFSRSAAGTGSLALGTQTMFLYDDEFLYIAFRSKKIAGISYSRDIGGPRQRDTNLDKTDRVEIQLDPHRNFSAFGKLTVDFRGFAADSWAKNVNWNPNWFIAIGETNEHWMIEAAVPLEMLQKQKSSAWGISLRRIVPNVGVDCWNAENGFGVLLFED